jgi:hypothetical protein
MVGTEDVSRGLGRSEQTGISAAEVEKDLGVGIVGREVLGEFEGEC